MAPQGLRTECVQTGSRAPLAPELTNEPAELPTDVPLGKSRQKLPACSSEGILLTLTSK